MSAFEIAKAEMQAKGQPAVRFELAADAGRTCLGGAPQLPRNYSWPEHAGKPLAFIAQIDAGAVARALGLNRPDWFPDRGSLAFFYDSDQDSWGFDPNDRGSCHVAWFSETEMLVPVNPPEAVPKEARFALRPLLPVAATSFPSVERLSVDPMALEDEETWQLHAIAKGGQEYGSLHQVSGYPFPVQRDTMELNCQLASNGIFVGDSEYEDDPRTAVLSPGAVDWRLLLQVDSAEEIAMMWGDSGILYFWVREQDARAKDFSNVWAVLQCT